MILRASLNLNFFKNIRNLLKNQLQARNPLPKDKPAIIQTVIDEWDEIPAEEIQKYVDTTSMPGRIVEVVTNLGDPYLLIGKADKEILTTMFIE